MKILLFAISLSLIAGCVSESQDSANYSLAKVTQAATTALDKVRPSAQFYLYNIPPGKTTDSKAVLRFIKECSLAGQAGAIASDRLDSIYGLLQAAMAESKNTRFDGLILIIVAAKKSPERFDALLLPRGITPVYATY